MYNFGERGGEGNPLFMLHGNSVICSVCGKRTNLGCGSGGVVRENSMSCPRCRGFGTWPQAKTTTIC